MRFIAHGCLVEKRDGGVGERGYLWRSKGKHEKAVDPTAHTDLCPHPWPKVFFRAPCGLQHKYIGFWYLWECMMREWGWYCCLLHSLPFGGFGHASASVYVNFTHLNDFVDWPNLLWIIGKQHWSTLICWVALKIWFTGRICIQIYVLEYPFS